MTRSPRMDLPSGAMPWGRWVQGEVEDAKSTLEAEAANASSKGRIFSSRMNLMAQQIRDMERYSMQRSPAPEITTYISDGAAATDVSRTVEITPPAGTRSLIGIVNFDVIRDNTLDSNLFVRYFTVGGTRFEPFQWEAPFTFAVSIYGSRPWSGDGSVSMTAGVEYAGVLGLTPRVGNITLTNFNFFLISYGAA